MTRRKIDLDFHLTDEEKDLFPMHMPNVDKTYAKAKLFCDRMYSFGIIAKIHRRKRHKHKVYDVILFLDNEQHT